jgi:anti-sigma B factor antagonist
MSKTPSSLLVSVADQVAIIKITGRANFASSVNFKLLVNELRDSGFKNFVLDLSECITMDSTFLGVLAGMALKLSDNPKPNSCLCLQLLNANQRISDLLENLGVSHLFHPVTGNVPAGAVYDPAAQAAATPTREAISETCLEAHKTLMAINPDNVPKFKEVAQFLAEDLKKLKAQSCH